jgi:hypothetical protein
VLTGAHLSEVQEVALQMLMVLEQRREATQFVEDLRARLAANHPGKVRELFPEWFPNHQPADIDEIDDSLVDWTTPGSDRENSELERWISERSAGTITAGALGGDWM